MEFIKYIIIVLVLVIIALAIAKSKKKDFKIEVNKLVDYLGGKDNIISTEVNLSRFKVTLKNVSIVDKEAIQKGEVSGKIYSKNQRFAGVKLPTGAGKSFVAMAEMMRRTNQNMVYFAPQEEILSQVQRHIVKYVLGKEILTEESTDTKHFLICKGAIPIAYIRIEKAEETDNTKISMFFVADGFDYEEIYNYGNDFANNYVW